MIIQITLMAFFLLLTIYAVTQHKNTPLVAAAMVGLSALGIVFTVLPALTTDLARIVGVGRGTDLILYIFIVLALTAILILHLRLRANAEITTILIRKIAIQSARVPAKPDETRP
jgi:small membrane protein